jgi:predicted dehydrogenase
LDGGALNIPRATNLSHSVVLIGAGRRGLGAHLPALVAGGHFRLTGIVDTKERIAQLREITTLTAPMYDSLDQVLADQRPDLAIVATPHDCHVPLARQLLRAGVPTLLEKPPACSAPELATLLTLSQEFQTPIATSLPLHHQRGYRRFRRLLASPGLTDAQVTIRATVTSWQGADSWRRSRERAGGGVLIDLGYHYLELIVSCLGSPDEKSVQLTRAPGPGCEVEDEAQLLLQFDERRLLVRLWLQSHPQAAKGTELSIRRDGAVVYHATPGAAPDRGRDHGQPQPTPAAAQLKVLVASGFLNGRGDWQHVLHRQYAVMRLIDDLYACAAFGASLPRTADQARESERTPA